MSGKTGVLFIGALGGVASTTIAGLIAVNKNLAPIRGLISTDAIFSPLKLKPLDQFVFGGWDIREDSIRNIIKEHGIIRESIMGEIESELEHIKIYKAPFINIDEHVQTVYQVKGQTFSLQEAVIQLEKQISSFKESTEVERVIVVNTASTEKNIEQLPIYQSLAAFEQGLHDNSKEITPGMIYAYAALKARAAYVNFTPSVTVDIPALLELAEIQGVPLAGKDGRTGQTLYKHVLGKMFKQRGLKVTGWYSTNILGNADGAVLQDPKHSVTKINSKAIGLESILGYSDFDHLVRIDYFPLRADHKEAWDTIDFEGWLGERMSMKINWIGMDSILAAPLIVDLIRFMDEALQEKHTGVMEHLSLFFKSPYETNEYSLDIQYHNLLNYTNAKKQGR